MRNSRDVALLRGDVARNCRTFLRLCAEAGLKVLVTQTVRDADYQAALYAQGRTAPGKIVTNSRRPTFHSDKAGLAFDIAQNVKGQEYSDAGFFQRAGAIGRQVGFSWGGDWDRFPDRPHFQWDAGGKYSGTDILGGRYPPAMPAYEEEEVTQEQFNRMMDAYLAELKERQPADYSAEARKWAEEKGIIRGNAKGEKQYGMYCTREQMITFLKRLEDSRAKE